MSSIEKLGMTFALTLNLVVASLILISSTPTLV